ncbi:MAG: MFS transporter [bacterium]|nr:MFS transporter [bacterium]
MKKNFESQSGVIGLFMATMSVATGIVSTLLGRLVKKYSKKKLLLTAFILYTLSMAILPFMPNLWLLLVPTLLFGAANGLNIPTVHAFLARLAPQENRAAFMSANGTVLRLGQTLGPMLMGTAFVLLGLPGTFFTGAFLALVTLVMIKFLIK